MFTYMIPFLLIAQQIIAIDQYRITQLPDDFAVSYDARMKILANNGTVLGFITKNPKDPVPFTTAAIWSEKGGAVPFSITDYRTMPGAFNESGLVAVNCFNTRLINRSEVMLWDTKTDQLIHGPWGHAYAISDDHLVLIENPEAITMWNINDQSIKFVHGGRNQHMTIQEKGKTYTSGLLHTGKSLTCVSVNKNETRLCFGYDPYLFYKNALYLIIAQDTVQRSKSGAFKVRLNENDELAFLTAQLTLVNGTLQRINPKLVIQSNLNKQTSSDVLTDLTELKDYTKLYVHDFNENRQVLLSGLSPKKERHYFLLTPGKK